MDFHYATQQEVCRCLELDHVWGLHETRQKGLIARYQNATSTCSETQPAAAFLLFGFCVLIGLFFFCWLLFNRFLPQESGIGRLPRGSKRIIYKCSVPIDLFSVPVGLSGGFKCWFKATINSTSATSRSDRGADMKTWTWFHCGSMERIYSASTIWIWTHIKQSWCRLLRRHFLPRL